VKTPQAHIFELNAAIGEKEHEKNQVRGEEIQLIKKGMKDTSRQHSERQGKAVYLLFHRGKSDIRRQNYQKKRRSEQNKMQSSQNSMLEVNPKRESQKSHSNFWDSHKMLKQLPINSAIVWKS